MRVFSLKGSSASRFALVVLLAVSACTTPRYGGAPEPHNKVGQPYKIDGRWYYPKDDPTYEAVGTASWYGPGFQGRKTANGEVFDMNLFSAAHPTLPLPCMVEVVNLDNGQKTIVRVNDRGPFARDRIIDLSRAAARQLGFEHQGTAHVKVRYLGPASLAAKAPRDNIRTAQATSATPVSAATPAPKLAPDTALYLIRVAALSNLSNVDALKAQLGEIGPLRVVRVDKEDGSAIYRINMGPFRSIEEASERLEDVRAVGYVDATLITLRPESASS